MIQTNMASIIQESGNTKYGGNQVKLTASSVFNTVQEYVKPSKAPFGAMRNRLSQMAHLG